LSTAYERSAVAGVRGAFCNDAISGKIQYTLTAVQTTEAECQLNAGARSTIPQSPTRRAR